MVSPVYYHVYPVEDLNKHNLDSKTCDCSPVVEDCLVIHQAFDGRELIEKYGLQ